MAVKPVVALLDHCPCMDGVSMYKSGTPKASTVFKWKTTSVPTPPGTGLELSVETMVLLRVLVVSCFVGLFCAFNFFRVHLSNPNALCTPPPNNRVLVVLLPTCSSAVPSTKKRWITALTFV